MPSIVPNFEYDIFISYRHNDNRSGWVTEFVNALQEELAATENKIGFARQYYNDAALRYKNRIELFPGNMVANLFGFRAEPFFEIEAAQERVAPQVKF